MAVKAPVIAGKYTLLRKLGAGGMAEVFLAKQESEGGFEKLVVIKRILPHLADGASNTDFVAMFLDEARLASDLRHPNVVTVIDVGKTSQTYFIVMEFLHGQDIRKVQRKNAAWQEMVPFSHGCQMVIDAAGGLHYAHTKKDLHGNALTIVHRDVSPQNIIVTYEGSTKIVDFGIAKAATQSTHTSTGVLKGKYTYMSPEQAAGEQVDARTDQFALGIVLWELLTMRRLFKRESEMATLEAIMHGKVPPPSRFRDDTPKSIDDVCMKALSNDRKNRFTDCEELALALEDALAKERIVHSQARLAQYMRRLFADTLAEEATLGLVNPDGSLSKNLTPFTLPPAEDKRSDEKPPQQPVDATTADRKSARSETGKRKPQEPESKPSDIATDPTVVDAKKTAKADKDKDKKARTDERDRADRADKDRLERERGDKERADRADRVDKERAERDRLARELRVIARDDGRTAKNAVDPDVRRTRIAAAIVGVIAAAAVLVGYLAVSAWQHSGPGQLVVRSEPRGARVYVDGKDTGERTPALVRNVEAGTPHKVRVELDGKATEEVVTIPARGATHEVTLELPR